MDCVRVLCTSEKTLKSAKIDEDMLNNSLQCFPFLFTVTVHYTLNCVRNLIRSDPMQSDPIRFI